MIKTEMGMGKAQAELHTTEQVGRLSCHLDLIKYVQQQGRERGRGRWVEVYC